MKKFVSVLILTGVLVLPGFVLAQDLVIIPDVNLKNAICDELSKVPPCVLTNQDLAELEELSLNDPPGDEKIINLSGLQYANGLKLLRLKDHSISDISILISLSPFNLEDLNLRENNISDISALGAGFASLEDLDLRDNNISDISSLVANSNFGVGDKINLKGNPLDGEDCNDLQSLEDRLGSSGDLDHDVDCDEDEDEDEDGNGNNGNGTVGEEIISSGLSPCEMKHEVQGCIADMTDPDDEDEETDCNKKAGANSCNVEVCCLLDMVYTIADWIFVILLVVAGLFIIWGAFGFVLSGGDPEKVTSARNKLIWALVGIIVAFLARGLVILVTQIIAK